jgi:hypothetical protein
MASLAHRSPRRNPMESKDQLRRTLRRSRRGRVVESRSVKLPSTPIISNIPVNSHPWQSILSSYINGCCIFLSSCWRPGPSETDCIQIYATSEERKQRNRQAQAAFRERRTEYIKQLENTIKHHEETLQTLQQSHRNAADECLMLRYKNSLLERILLEKGTYSALYS